MNIIELIERKKRGLTLTDGEIQYFVDGILSGDICDYQASAMLMAICLKGFSFDETVALTRAMRYSGDQVDLSAFSGVKIDKHSTGGVGDSTSFLIMPILSALGYNCVKMSGKGLGHTGGTLDKLQSVGAKYDISGQKLIDQINSVGFAILGQTANVAPADKYLYALRDVTATVDSIPLIASSIMSKKLASGGDVIVLDVKCGKGAFMKDFESAISLAETMCAIGRAEGKKTIALITDMNEPLSCNIGNSIEVIGALDALSGKNCRLKDLSVALASNAISVVENIDYATAFEKVIKVINDGSALKKFQEMIKAQGGDLSNIKVAECETVFYSDKDGYISEIDALKLGEFVCSLGGGRLKKEDDIDYGVGAILSVKVGDKVNKGDKLITVYSNKPLTENQRAKINSIFGMQSETLDKPRLVYAKINDKGEIIL